MKNLLLLLAGTTIICFSGCNDDDDNNVNTMDPATRTELISSNDWMMVSAVQTENGQTVDLFTAQPVTAQDDVFNFSEDGAVIREEGVTKEATAADVVDSGTWSFMNEERELKIEMQSLPVNDQIVELSKDRLVLRNFDGQSEIISTFRAE
jgi:hypothetical protein